MVSLGFCKGSCWYLRVIRVDLSGFWVDVKNQRNFFEHIGKSMNIKTNNDWYKISTADICRMGGEGMYVNNWYTN